MKRLSLIFLTVLYLIPSIGVCIQAHYCGGKLASVSFTGSNVQGCQCGSKKKMKNCCKDKTFSFKIKDTQHNSSQLTADFKTFQFQPIILAFQDFQFLPSAISESFYYSHHPPDVVTDPLFLLNRTLRI